MTWCRKSRQTVDGVLDFIALANNDSTTQLYDRRDDRITLDELVKIN
jgi:hypothetical protein